MRKGKVHGVLSERTRIGAHIRENLRALGLKRVSHHLTLDEILSEEEPDSEAGLESQRAAAQGQGTAEAWVETAAAQRQNERLVDESYVGTMNRNLFMATMLVATSEPGLGYVIRPGHGDDERGN